MLGKSITTLAGLSTLKLNGSFGKISEKTNLICTLSPGNDEVLILSNVTALAEKTPKLTLNSNVERNILFMYLFIIIFSISQIYQI